MKKYFKPIYQTRERCGIVPFVQLKCIVPICPYCQPIVCVCVFFEKEN